MLVWCHPDIDIDQGPMIIPTIGLWLEKEVTVR